MKAPRLLALLLPIGCAQAPAPDDARNAAPAATAADEQPAIMDRIERDLRLPAGAAPLNTYSRYYTWQDRADGVRKVLAIYVREPNPARRWVANSALPLVMDGGCDIVSFSYDVAARRIDDIACNGEA